MVTRRALLLAVAGLLCAAALFAIGVLVLGHFGRTETRVLQTTVILAGAGLLAVPGVVLAEKGRGRRVAALNAAAALLVAAFGVAMVWGFTPGRGRVVGTAVVLAAATAQVAALLGRRRPDDPPVVPRLFTASVATVIVLAAMVLVQIWGDFESSGYARALGVVAILDALLVALQPLLARLKPPSEHYRLQLTLESADAPLLREIDAPDLAAAAAQAIRDAERGGDHVRRFDVEEPLRPR